MMRGIGNLLDVLYFNLILCIYREYNEVLCIYRDYNEVLCIYREYSEALCIYRDYNEALCIYREYNQALRRLGLMTRGIGDPLVALYSRCFLCRVGVCVAPAIRDHLMPCFDDFLFTYKQVFLFNGHWCHTFCQIEVAYIKKWNYVVLGLLCAQCPD